MSDYRDDSHVQMTGSDASWMASAAIAESNAKVKDLVLHRLITMTEVTGVFAADALGFPNSLLNSSGELSAEAFGRKAAHTLVTQAGRLIASASGKLRVLHVEEVSASAETWGLQSSGIGSQGFVSAQAFGTRHAHSLVNELGKIAAQSFAVSRSLAESDATISDETVGKLKARILVVEAATVSAEVLDSFVGSLVAESIAVVSDEAWGQLKASSLIEESAVIWASIPGGLDGGGAWTANVDTWAMSRYEPFAFSAVAVINGQLYGVTEQGVYALSGGEEVIEGRITTGKLDLSGNERVHPLGAYLEYELDDSAEAGAVMTVATTQGGSVERYSYQLDGPEQSEELVNGRFRFGRGLRGRHFALDLSIKGRHAYINDLRLDVAQTKRRV